jgi:hypothetical protein
MFRVAVMLVAAVIGYHAWQLYGPPADRLKSIALRLIEIAQAALGEADQADNGKPQQASDSPAPPPLALGSSTSAEVPQAQALVQASEIRPALGTPPILAPPALATPAPAPTAISPDVATPDTELLALYSRLEKLGVVEPRLAAWGSDGQLHRFCCRATVGGDSNFKRHFEAIAAEPRLAVQEVVAKVEAWRTAQQKSDRLGTALR